MRIVFRTGLCVPVMVVAVAGAAAAQGFDGVYAGVSANVSGPSHCRTPETPGPLTITGGNAASATGFFSGSVDAGGHVVLHTKESTRIDRSGFLRAGGGTTQCAYTIVWKKR